MITQEQLFMTLKDCKVVDVISVSSYSLVLVFSNGLKLRLDDISSTGEEHWEIENLDEMTQEQGV